jgi:small subunit ribosomal protein S21
MLILKVKRDGLEATLKKYKSKVIKTRMIKELRERQAFEKKSVKKRKQHLKACYIQQKWGGQ